jgi:hypothetical protein
MTHFREYNLLARCYLDFQHTRISIGHRIRIMLEQVLIENGLMEEVKITTKNKNGKEKNRYERRLILKKEPSKPKEDHPYYEKVMEEYEEELAEVKEYNIQIQQKAQKIADELPEKSKAYGMMFQRHRQLQKDEKEMLQQCKQLFEVTRLWEWCERVKGLGEVAAMTFIAYIDPEKVREPKSVWRLFGLNKDSKLVAGQKANFNLELKGRMYVIRSNIVMQGDSYYSQIYRMKKEYYNAIEEIIEKKDSMIGWKGWVDNMAKIVMLKLVVSHAVEIILKENGLPFISSHENNRYLPPKPENPEDVQRYLAMFKADMPEKIRRRNERYAQEKKEAAEQGITVEQLRKNQQALWDSRKKQEVVQATS